MFLPNSRYANAGTYSVPTNGGVKVNVSRLPVRTRVQVRGFHSRTEGQRPDGIAAHYLADATAFWRLCDAGDALAPDALAARDRIAVPAKGR
jgi:hypothetical protein